MPSSDTNQILDDLLTSLYEKYQVDLTTSRTSSSFVFESVEYELRVQYEFSKNRFKAWNVIYLNT